MTFATSSLALSGMLSMDMMTRGNDIRGWKLGAGHSLSSAAPKISKNT
jgi:hypothetical protein